MDIIAISNQSMVDIITRYTMARYIASQHNNMRSQRLEGKRGAGWPGGHINAQRDKTGFPVWTQADRQCGT